MKADEQANWESHGHKVSRETTIWGFADDRNHFFGWAAANAASESLAIGVPTLTERVPKYTFKEHMA